MGAGQGEESWASRMEKARLGVDAEKGGVDTGGWRWG